jgi:hypothetical protein
MPYKSLLAQRRRNISIAAARALVCPVGSPGDFAKTLILTHRAVLNINFRFYKLIAVETGTSMSDVI